MNYKKFSRIYSISRVSRNLVKTYKSQNLTDEEILNAMKNFGFTSAIEYALNEE